MMRRPICASARASAPRGCPWGCRISELCQPCALSIPIRRPTSSTGVRSRGRTWRDRLCAARRSSTRHRRACEKSTTRSLRGMPPHHHAARRRGPPRRRRSRCGFVHDFKIPRLSRPRARASCASAGSGGAPGGDRFVEGFAVHVGVHQHAPAQVIDGDSGDDAAVFVEINCRRR